MENNIKENGKKARVYTVTELTREIRITLEDRLTAIWVEGEVSNFKAASSGHCYFSLKDDSSTLRCVIFRNSSFRLNFTIEDGMHLQCFGKISVYDKQGQYQLYVESVEQKGKGALYIAFERLKEKLYKEGLFDEIHKRPVPYLPMRVGVVTSATGAAIQDILNVARRRYANIEITIYPVKVQGEGAKEEIADAIAALNEYNTYLGETGSDEQSVDVMIVGRGGGSIEDLWAFNEEIVARAIFASEIPVISAVGHEIDYTISDFVADRRAPTPSAAAELVIPEKEELSGMVEKYRERMEIALRSEIDLLESRVMGVSASYVLREPVNFVLQLKQRVDDLERRICVRMGHSIEIKTKTLEKVHGKLGTLSPLSILGRGYSITFKDGAVIKKSSGLSSGDMILTRFASGEANSKVEEVR